MGAGSSTAKKKNSKGKPAPPVSVPAQQPQQPSGPPASSTVPEPVVPDTNPNDPLDLKNKEDLDVEEEGSTEWETDTDASGGEDERDANWEPEDSKERDESLLDFNDEDGVESVGVEGDSVNQVVQPAEESERNALEPVSEDDEEEAEEQSAKSASVGVEDDGVGREEEQVGAGPGDDGGSLLEACRDGRLDRVRLEIQKGTKLADVLDAESNGCLHYAALHAHTDVLWELMDSGCPPLAPNRDRNLPLHYAVASGQLPVVDQILSTDTQAQLSYVNKDGFLPCHLAALEGRGGAEGGALLARLVGTDGLTVRTHGGLHVLHMACLSGDVATVATVLRLARAADATPANPAPVPARLHSANPAQVGASTGGGGGEVMRELLDGTDAAGDSALHLLAPGGTPNAADITAILLQAGADASVLNSAEQTPYDVATAHQQHAIAALLAPPPTLATNSHPSTTPASSTLRLASRLDAGPSPAPLPPAPLASSASAPNVLRSVQNTHRAVRYAPPERLPSLTPSGGGGGAALILRLRGQAPLPLDTLILGKGATRPGSTPQGHTPPSRPLRPPSPPPTSSSSVPALPSSSALPGRQRSGRQLGGGGSTVVLRSRKSAPDETLPEAPRVGQDLSLSLSAVAPRASGPPSMRHADDPASLNPAHAPPSPKPSAALDANSQPVPGGESMAWYPEGRRPDRRAMPQPSAFSTPTKGPPGYFADDQWRRGGGWVGEKQRVRQSHATSPQRSDASPGQWSQPAEVAASRKRHALRTHARLVRSVGAGLVDLLEAVEGGEDRLRQEAAELAAEVETECERLHAMIEQKRENLLGMIEAEEKSRLRSVSSHRDEFNRQLQTVQDTLDQVEQALSVEQPDDFVSVVETQQLPSRLKRLAQQQVPEEPVGLSKSLALSIDTSSVRGAISRLHLTHAEGPEAPRGLACTELTDCCASLTWRTVDGASKYTLQMARGATGGGGPDACEEEYCDVYEGNGASHVVWGLEGGGGYFFRIKSVADNAASSSWSLPLKVVTPKESGHVWSSRDSHRGAAISPDASTMQRAPSVSGWVAALTTKPLLRSRRFFSVQVQGDSPYMYVGIAYEGANTGEAYGSRTVLWRKGSGEVYLHGVKLPRAKFLPAPGRSPAANLKDGQGFKSGDVVGVLVDFEQTKVTFYCNGVADRTVSGVNTGEALYGMVSIGAGGLSARIVEGGMEPTPPY